MMNKKVHMLLMLVLIIGGINWGLVGAYKLDLIDYFVKNEMIKKGLYITVGIVALYIASKRNTWLPFLGETILPCNLLVKKEPKETNEKIKIKVGKNKKVVYWAAEEEKEGEDKQEVWKAYGELKNSGVVESDENGEVEIKYKKPQGYYVNKLLGKKELESHIHYRVCDNRMKLGEVKTLNLE